MGSRDSPFAQNINERAKAGQAIPSSFIPLAEIMLALSLLALALSASPAAAFIECNVLNYGAVADNSTDLGPALTAAWTKCVIPQVTTTVATNVLLYVPAGNFLLKSNVVFDGAANWNLHIAGNIYLPYLPSLTGTMLTFEVGNIIFVVRKC
jgi:rhamnogalacturonan hydrolase